jgi:hypothetical protein
MQPDGLPVSKPRPRTGETGPPSGEGQPSDKPRWRLSKRGWILAGSGLTALLLLIVVVANARIDSVIFEDDFTSREHGWPDVGSETTPGGRYQNDAYRVHAVPGGSAGGAPERAGAVYPIAPPSIHIEVETRQISGSAQTTQYGLFCRLVPDTSWYAFEVEDDRVTIWRNPADDGNTVALATGVAPVQLGRTNELRATCEETDARTVYLQLLVNGQSVAQTEDADPLPAGGVGLYVNGSNSQTAMEVEFDDFKVKKA